jgi:hypothetical protein
MSQTLEERIAFFEKLASGHLSEDYEICTNSYDDAFYQGLDRGEISSAIGATKIIKELQEELDGSEKMYKGALEFSTRKEEENQALQKKLDEALAKVEIAKKGLEALSICDAGQAEWVSILNQCYDQLIYNKQGE